MTNYKGIGRSVDLHKSNQDSSGTAPSPRTRQLSTCKTYSKATQSFYHHHQQQRHQRISTGIVKFSDRSSQELWLPVQLLRDRLRHTVAEVTAGWREVGRTMPAPVGGGIKFSHKSLRTGEKLSQQTAHIPLTLRGEPVSRGATPAVRLIKSRPTSAVLLIR